MRYIQLLGASFNDRRLTQVLVRWHVGGLNTGAYTQRIAPRNLVS